MAPDPAVLAETIIRVTEAIQRKIERFLKDVLIPDYDKKKDHSFDVLSLEDSTPPHCPVLLYHGNLLREHRPKKTRRRRRVALMVSQ